MKLRRIDSELVRRGLAKSRSAAAQMIEDGRVKLDGQIVLKPARQMDPAQAIVVEESDDPEYVSRGAHKLAGALDALGDKAPLIEGRRALDAGASTGGFTDVLLRRGAASVVAVDVGYGQLAWKLRMDERVTNMERTNIRHVTPAMLDEPVDFASIDVAFISLAKVLPAVRNLLKGRGEVAALIKPQFEAGRENVGKKGVVREPRVHEDVIRNVFQAAQKARFCVKALSYSPVKGPEGNIEYLMHLVCASEENTASSEVFEDEILAVVREAHTELDK